MNQEEIKNYIELNNLLAEEDPYILKSDFEHFLNNIMPKINTGEYQIEFLKLNNEYAGFIKIEHTNNIAFIDDIFIKNNFRTDENYSRLISESLKSEKKTKYIGPLSNTFISSALAKNNFILAKEHIQMEKNISNLTKNPVSKKSFSEINDVNYIVDFMKSCMSDIPFNYSNEEIAEIIKSKNDLSYILYDKEPVGFVIAFINNKRNEQEGKKVLYIEEIAIRSDKRNMGYAKMIISDTFYSGIERGMDIARLHVYRDNFKALNLYKKLEFTEIKSIGHWIYNK